MKSDPEREQLQAFNEKITQSWDVTLAGFRRHRKNAGSVRGVYAKDSCGVKSDKVLASIYGVLNLGDNCFYDD